MGNESYQEFLDLLKDRPRSPEVRRAMREAASASNFSAQPGMPPPAAFDVWAFDKRAAQARLEAAFRSKGSTGGARQVMIPLSGQTLDSLGTLFGNGAAAGQTRVRSPRVVLHARL